jgi:hypothetical protein
VETETTLVGAESRVKLHTETTVDLELALVILPDDAELNHALGDGDNSKGLAVLGVSLEEGRVLKSRGEFCKSQSWTASCREISCIPL